MALRAFQQLPKRPCAVCTARQLAVQHTLCSGCILQPFSIPHASHRMCPCGPAMLAGRYATG